jgi:hypothetical protein
MTVIVFRSGCALGLTVTWIGTSLPLQAARKTNKKKSVDTTKRFFIKASLMSGYTYYTENLDDKTTPHFSRIKVSFINNCHIDTFPWNGKIPPNMEHPVQSFDFETKSKRLPASETTVVGFVGIIWLNRKR